MSKISKKTFSVKQPDNDNALKWLVAVGYDEDEYLDILRSLDNCGLPFQVMFLDKPEEMEDLLQFDAYNIVAIMVQNDMNNTRNMGVKWLTNNRRSLKNIPCILSVDHTRFATFAINNSLADSAIVKPRGMRLKHDTLFNAIWDAAAKKQPKDVGVLQVQKSMF